ncbi:hypothetical protein ACFONN_15925 [Dyella humi]|uniref:Uncharacterized protein n=1 Tax=Dyella humi TaxID=1770547 RepID=A0ABW8IMQ3_9GAMM
MSNFIDRVLAAYRPLYLRGLLMDGQYRLPATQEEKPKKGNRVVHLTPAFEPGRKRVLIAPVPASASLRVPPTDEPSGGWSGA